MSDLLVVKNGIVVTMDNNRNVYEDGTVVIQGNRILEVGAADDISGEYNADITIDGGKKLIFPGP